MESLEFGGEFFGTKHSPCHSLQVKCNRAAARLSRPGSTNLASLRVPVTWSATRTLLFLYGNHKPERPLLCSGRRRSPPASTPHPPAARLGRTPSPLCVFSACSHCLDWNWIDQVSWRSRSNLDTRCSSRSWPALFVDSFLPGILEWLNPDRGVGIDTDHQSSRRHVNAR